MERFFVGLVATAWTLVVGCTTQPPGLGPNGMQPVAGTTGAAGAAGLAAAAGTLAMAGSSAVAGGGGAAVSAGAGGAAGTAASPENLKVAPMLLSQTGLFSDMPTQTLAPDVQPYQPKYALWSDGADKRRWVRLPPGSQIDSSDMDNWKYPVGTKLWKEFGKNGKALETRYMAKYGPDGMDWLFIAYQWNAAGTDALAVPGGVKDTAGTQHDIPSDLTCLKCHEGKPDGALGLSAIQLSHDGPGATLASLSAAGSLSHAPPAALTIPGDAIAEKALGYLHANCGSCHNPSGGEAFNKNSALIYWQTAAQLASVEQTSTYVNLVTNTNGKLDLLIKGLDRMKSRPEKQMPPVATEIVDDEGVAIVDAWLKQLQLRFPQAGAGGMP